MPDTNVPTAPVTDPWAPPLPKAVREQVERANQLAREAGIANVPPPSAGPEGEGQSTTVVRDPPIPDVPGASPEPMIATEGFAPRTPQPDANYAPGAGQHPASGAPEPAPGPADWEARYNSLQGKYNTELPELRAQVRMLQDMMTQTPRAAPAPQPAPAAPQPRYINPPAARDIPREDVAEFGQELIDATSRWTDHRYAPLLQDWERRLLTLETAQQQLNQRAATQGVDAQLARLVPDWEAINNDDAFKTWLGRVERFSGRTYLDLANEAYAGGDAHRVAAFFQTYLSEQSRAAPAVGTQLRQTAQSAGAMPGSGPAALLPLAELAAPGRGPVSGTPWEAPQGRIWSRGEITSFYSQLARGMWRGRERDAHEIDIDIQRAGNEGRVRP